MLKLLSDINQKVDSQNQIVNSHSQSITKLEAQMGHMTNTLNKREEGTLPCQPVANPKGHYMVEGYTSHHQQVQAITTLRSGRRVDNHVQEKVDVQTAIPHNLQKEKGKQVNIEASSSSAPTLKIPYEPQAPFPQGTFSLWETRRENTRYDGGLQTGKNQPPTP